MVYTSVLSLLEQEEKICREIQTRINILDGADQAKKDGFDMDRHKALLERASDDLRTLLPGLHKVRAELGGRLMMLERLAEDVIRRNLQSADQGKEPEA